MAMTPRTFVRRGVDELVEATIASLAYRDAATPMAGGKGHFQPPTLSAAGGATAKVDAGLDPAADRRPTLVASHADHVSESEDGGFDKSKIMRWHSGRWSCFRRKDPLTERSLLLPASHRCCRRRLRRKAAHCSLLTTHHAPRTTDH